SSDVCSSDLIEGVVVAGRERVGADQDAAPGLGAEAFPASARVERGQVAVALGAIPIADAVVAGEVRASLGRGDEVVAGEAEVDRPRQAALPHLGAELLCEQDRLGDGLAHAGLDALRVVQLPGNADADSL